MFQNGFYTYKFVHEKALDSFEFISTLNKEQINTMIIEFRKKKSIQKLPELGQFYKFVDFLRNHPSFLELISHKVDFSTGG